MRELSSGLSSSGAVHEALAGRIDGCRGFNRADRVISTAFPSFSSSGAERKCVIVDEMRRDAFGSRVSARARDPPEDEV